MHPVQGKLQPVLDPDQTQEVNHYLPNAELIISISPRGRNRTETWSWMRNNCLSTLKTKTAEDIDHRCQLHFFPLLSRIPAPGQLSNLQEIQDATYQSNGGGGGKVVKSRWLCYTYAQTTWPPSSFNAMTAQNRHGDECPVLLNDSRLSFGECSACKWKLLSMMVTPLPTSVRAASVAVPREWDSTEMLEHQPKNLARALGRT